MLLAASRTLPSFRTQRFSAGFSLEVCGICLTFGSMMVGFLFVLFFKPETKKKIEAYGFKKEREQVLAPTGSYNGQGKGVVWL